MLRGPVPSRAGRVFPSVRRLHLRLFTVVPLRGTAAVTELPYVPLHKDGHRKSGNSPNPNFCVVQGRTGRLRNVSMYFQLC